MVKSNKKVIISVSVVVLVLLISIFAYIGLTPQATISGSSFTPVYCKGYEFTCCQGTSLDTTNSISNKVYAVCPTTATECVITNLQSSAYIYYGKTNCRLTSTFANLFQDLYQCDDQVRSSILSAGAVNIRVPKGSQIWADRSNVISMTVKGQRLAFTGTSSDAFAGVPVAGSNNCVFQETDSNIFTRGFDSDGLGSNLGTSYTIPVNDCVLSWTGARYICGNLEESCKIDSDCSGHTFGNRECNGRTLQTYGCTANLPTGVTKVSDGSLQGADAFKGTSLYSGSASRCDIVSTQAVQCCGDTDCGSSQVCDTKTFTCKAPATVECTRDSQCGVSTQCDFVKLELKTPDCLSTNTCGYKVQKVECCNDNNCDVNSFCDLTKHTCEAKFDSITSCPFSCCMNDAGYTNRACPTGQFCVSNNCQSTPQCTSTSDCSANQQCVSGSCEVVSNSTCADKFGGLVSGNIGTKDECNFLCQLGITKPQTVNVCVYDYTPAVIIGLFALIIIIALIFKGASKDGENILKNPTFWKVVGVIVFLLIVILFFKTWIKYALWLVIGIVILLLLDIFLFRGKIRKYIGG